MEVLLNILNFFGGSLCHQILSRSFLVSDFSMPLCSRCTGIYLGFILSLVVAVILDRSIKGGFPSIKIILVILAVILLMGFDVFISTLGIFDSNNIIRFITGFLSGWFLVLMILPLRNMVMLRKYTELTYLNSPGKFSAWLIVGIILIPVFIFTYDKIFVVWAAAEIAGMVIFIAYITIILGFTFIKRISGSITTKKSYWLSISISIFISAAFLTLLSYVRRFLI